MNIRRYRSTTQGFTLSELLIVITIMGLLAALTLQGYTYAMRSSKRRVTDSTMAGVQSSLERYHEKFGEYPEPATNSETMDILPGKKYNVAGARCLYQALRGDGFDAIKLGSSNSNDEKAASDGKLEDSELDALLFKDMPQTMWRVVGGKRYILVDGFGFPFQYLKATPPAGNGNNSNSDAATTVNSTYDLWSYADDDKNYSSTSTQALKEPKIAAKWIKNW